MTYPYYDSIEAVPVLKFIEYDKVVVLLNGLLEVAKIEDRSNFRKDEKIYHITAPSGTVADVRIIMRDDHGVFLDTPILIAENIRIKE